MAGAATTDALRAGRSVEVPVLYGKVGPRELELQSDEPTGPQLDTDSRMVTVADARPIADKLSIDAQGFVLRRHEAVTPFEDGFIAFNLQRKRDLPPINRRYAEELIPLIAELSGGDEIVAQIGRMTVRATPRTGLVTSDPTAPLVHLDYTPQAIADALAETFAHEGRAIPPYRRVALYQTWRPLTPPPHDSVLAICDARSVSPDATVVLQTYTPGEQGDIQQIEVRLCTYEPGHKWYYFNAMRTDEILIFKGYDSADPQSASGAHVAFDDPAASDPNGRVSVEARFFVFYR